MKLLRVDSAARAELLHESRYLERARPGHGKKFVTEIKSIFAQIRRNPQAGKPDDEGCR
jgi:plasmid stabilization system protein ParE